MRIAVLAVFIMLTAVNAHCACARQTAPLPPPPGPPLASTPPPPSPNSNSNPPPLLQVHYGHSCLVPVDVTSLPCMYVFVDIKMDTEHFVASVR